MKKILLLTVCLVSGAVFAQELFPELAGLKRNNTVEKQMKAADRELDKMNREALKIVQKTEKLKEENAQQQQEAQNAEMDESEWELEQEAKALLLEEEMAAEAQGLEDLFAAEQAVVSSENPVNPEEEAAQEEEEEEENKRIIVYMSDAQATITPNKNFSYCFADLKFRNERKKPVTLLDVNVAYDDYDFNYKINNLVKDADQQESVTLVGTACEKIMDMPSFKVNRCVIEGLSEEACKKKVVFSPIKGSPLAGQ